MATSPGGYAYNEAVLSIPVNYENAAAVTPSDSTPLTHDAQALWIGGAGNVVVITVQGQTVTLSGVAAGTILPIAVSQVKATNTTATLIVALW